MSRDPVSPYYTLGTRINRYPAAFLEDIANKQGIVRLRDLKENKNKIAAGYGHQRRQWMEKQQVFLNWSRDKASVLIMRTKVEEGDQSPVTIAGKSYVQLQHSGKVSGIPVFLMSSLMHENTFKGIIQQLFIQLLEQGKIIKAVKEKKIEDHRDLIVRSQGNGDSLPWIAEFIRQISNHFEVLFWIDSLHAFEGDAEKSSDVERLVRTFVDLARKKIVSRPVKLLITCPRQSAIVDHVLNDWKSLPVLDLPSAEAFEQMYPKLSKVGASGSHRDDKTASPSELQGDASGASKSSTGDRIRSIHATSIESQKKGDSTLSQRPTLAQLVDAKRSKYSVVLLDGHKD